MNHLYKSSPTLEKFLCCPICRTRLEFRDDRYICQNSVCSGLFPLVNGIPILIDGDKSIFSIDDFVNERNTFFNLSPQNKFKQTLIKFLPDINLNIKSSQNYSNFAKLLSIQETKSRVLIIGGSIAGNGMEAVLENRNLELVETDVSFGSRTNLICDSHSLPFEDNSFDGVIAQAVLEHVVDPYQCVEEIYRVLKQDALVYAETPFMQQVHAACYDFTRFTYLGHRRLFRKFEEIDSGAGSGTGMALAWSYRAFLASLTRSKLLSKAIELLVRLTAFPFKYLDYMSIDNPATLDSASTYYFMGKKSDRILGDRELIKLYKGAQSI
jgi:SAM-dependent methyltransferase/uncharacterized protein YbaR (Trm112 family)